MAGSNRVIDPADESPACRGRDSRIQRSAADAGAILACGRGGRAAGGTRRRPRRRVLTPAAAMATDMPPDATADPCHAQWRDDGAFPPYPRLTARLNLLAPWLNAGGALRALAQDALNGVDFDIPHRRHRGWRLDRLRRPRNAGRGELSGLGKERPSQLIVALEAGHRPWVRIPGPRTRRMEQRGRHLSSTRAPERPGTMAAKMRKAGSRPPPTHRAPGKNSDSPPDSWRQNRKAGRIDRVEGRDRGRTASRALGHSRYA